MSRRVFFAYALALSALLLLTAVRAVGGWP